MKKHSQEILEAIINNSCHALAQLADTDESLEKMKANYIRHTVGKIKACELSEKQLLKLNTLLLGTLQDLNK